MTENIISNDGEEKHNLKNACENEQNDGDHACQHNPSRARQSFTIKDKNK